MPLVVKNLTHVYMPDSPFEQLALDQISMQVEDGQFVAVIGHTGSGKSTLIQHFNGLMKPTSGQIFVGDAEVFAKDTDLKKIRSRIGLVFQYPEYQLFEETVYKDIAFGPKNMKLDAQEIDRRVREACQMVHLDFDTLAQKSPFELSGGQKRRVAIAGVLAMQPDILVMDEPTAGLDPAGREEILGLMDQWHRQGRTIIMVSHAMDDVARFAQRVFVLSEGKLVLEGTPAQVFAQDALLERIGLGLPRAARLARSLRQAGFEIPDTCYTMDELERTVAAALESKRNGGDSVAR
jgi:energy-coupling factor transport system ATP-binding protein